MPVYLQANLDYLLFITLALLLFCGVHAWLLQGRLAMAGWLALLTTLATGWFFTEAAGRKEQLRMQQMVEGFAPTYARELERMGHAGISLETPPDDAAYLAMIEAEKRWLAANPSVQDIYTMRKAADGKLRMIVDSETDYNRNGQYEGAREGRTVIGEHYTEPFKAVDAVLRTGRRQFEEEINADRWGTSVAAVEPLFDATGRIEALLSVDFDAHTWVAAIQWARATAIGYLALLVLIIAAGWGAVAHHVMMRDLDAEHWQQARLRVEKMKLEALVNSIEGIVWECDAASYQFTFLSQQATRILGYSPEEIIADPDFWRSKLLHPEDDWAFERSEKVVEARKPYEFDYRMRTKDGKTILVRESGSILVDEQGEPLLVRGIFRDISAQQPEPDPRAIGGESLGERPPHALIPGWSETASPPGNS